MGRPYQQRPNDQVKALPTGQRVYRDTRTNRTVMTDARGVPRRIEIPGRDGAKIVTRGPHHERLVVTGRPGARVVSYGRHAGFVEHHMRPGYISRTYVVGERSYVHVYHERRYHGVPYYSYVPRVHYAPVFYDWAVAPWRRPVAYSWYAQPAYAPWYGYYAGYFAPEPVYTSPALWLTDFLLAQNLRLAYESAVAAGDGGADEGAVLSAGPPVLTPQVKALIAEEVRRQLAAERAPAVEPTAYTAAVAEVPPPALTEKFFVVSSNLDLVADGQPCTLMPGDVIQRRGRDIAPDGSVLVEVVSSKPGDCLAESSTTVDIAALQDMQNQFREQIHAGLEVMASNQAQGLPPAPPAAPQQVAAGFATAAADALSQLAAQEAEASRLEEDIRRPDGN